MRRAGPSPATICSPRSALRARPSALIRVERPVESMNVTPRRSSVMSGGASSSSFISSSSSRFEEARSSSPSSVTLRSAPLRSVSQRRPVTCRCDLNEGGGTEAAAAPVPLALERIRSSGAVRPGRCAALAVELRGEAVLLGLRRGSRVARAAERRPGVAVELVLAAVLTVGRDRLRVAARLALGDLLELRRDRRVGLARAALRLIGAAAARAQAERGERLRADDAVDLEIVPPLEGAHGALGARVVHTRDAHAERALDRGDGCAGRCGLGAVAGGRPAGGGEGDAPGHGHDRGRGEREGARTEAAPAAAPRRHAALTRALERAAALPTQSAVNRWGEHLRPFVLSLSPTG